MFAKLNNLYPLKLQAKSRPPFDFKRFLCLGAPSQQSEMEISENKMEDTPMPCGRHVKELKNQHYRYFPVNWKVKGPHEIKPESCQNVNPRKAVFFSDKIGIINPTRSHSERIRFREGKHIDNYACQAKPNALPKVANHNRAYYTPVQYNDTFEAFAKRDRCSCNSEYPRRIGIGKCPKICHCFRGQSYSQEHQSCFYQKQDLTEEQSSYTDSSEPDSNHLYNSLLAQFNKYCDKQLIRNGFKKKNAFGRQSEIKETIPENPHVSVMENKNATMMKENENASMYDIDFVFSPWNVTGSNNDIVNNIGKNIDSGRRPMSVNQNKNVVYKCTNVGLSESKNVISKNVNNDTKKVAENRNSYHSDEDTRCMMVHEKIMGDNADTNEWTENARKAWVSEKKLSSTDELSNNPEQRFSTFYPLVKSEDEALSRSKTRTKKKFVPCKQEAKTKFKPRYDCRTIPTQTPAAFRSIPTQTQAHFQNASTQTWAHFQIIPTQPQGTALNQFDTLSHVFDYTDHISEENASRSNDISPAQFSQLSQCPVPEMSQLPFTALTNTKFSMFVQTSQMQAKRIAQRTRLVPEKSQRNTQRRATRRLHRATLATKHQRDKNYIRPARHQAAKSAIQSTKNLKDIVHFMSTKHQTNKVCIKNGQRATLVLRTAEESLKSLLGKPESSALRINLPEDYDASFLQNAMRTGKPIVGILKTTKKKFFSESNDYYKVTLTPRPKII